VIRIKTEVAGPIGSDFRLLKDIFASLSYLNSSVLAVKQYPRRLIELGMVYNDAVDCRRTREEEISTEDGQQQAVEQALEEVRLLQAENE
jgi:hypothetical protein